MNKSKPRFLPTVRSLVIIQCALFSFFFFLEHLVLCMHFHPTFGPPSAFSCHVFLLSRFQCPLPFLPQIRLGPDSAGKLPRPLAELIKTRARMMGRDGNGGSIREVGEGRWKFETPHHCEILRSRSSY